jgi:transposase
MAPPADKTATTAERERLLALARRLESDLEILDAEVKDREIRLAEIADGAANEADRVKASSAILSSQAKRADRLTAELSATRRALRNLPTEGDPETVRALAERGAIPTVTDTQRIYGGRFVTGDDRKPPDLRRWDEALYEDMPESDRPL